MENTQHLAKYIGEKHRLQWYTLMGKWMKTSGEVKGRTGLKW